MNKINNQLVCNGDEGARDGGQRIREERAALWREAGEGLSKKATLQNGLRAEPWERLREGVRGRRNGGCKGPGAGAPGLCRAPR